MRLILKKGAVVASLLMLLVATSCNSYKKVPYLKNSAEYATMEQVATNFEPVIQPQDLLTITVTSPENPLVAQAYNLVGPSDGAQSRSLYSQPVLQHYIVDANGFVNIPKVGQVAIGGLTIPAAESLVLEKIKDDFSNPPTVVVRFVDYKISVLGEVNAPGSYTVKNGKVNVLQALAMARDLTVYGTRDNVKVIREDETGKKNVYELNLNDVAILNSPYYYLQQNDIVYVTPNKSKAKNSDIGSSTSLWFTGTSIVISLASLLLNILNK